MIRIEVPCPLPPRANNDGQRGGHKKTVPCPSCNELYRSDGARTWKRGICGKCSLKQRREETRARNRVECPVCGKEYFPKGEADKKKRTRCSRACAGIGVWTDEEIEWLKNFYEAAVGRPIDLRIAEMRLGRTRDAITIKAGRLGLPTALSRPVAHQAKLNLSETQLDPATLSARRSQRRKEQIAKHGHPRGFKGKSHSAQAKETIARKAREMWSDNQSPVNSDPFRQGLSDRAKDRWGTDERWSRGHSRGKAGKRADLGRYFRSRWEANYARFLNLQVGRGAISAWDYECQTFEFPIKRGTRSYLPDFKVVHLDGSHEWHEVKGWMDQKSRTKLKRMAKYYPDEVVVVVGAEWFRRAAKSGLADILPNWERA